MKPKVIRIIKLTEAQLNCAIENYICDTYGIFLYGRKIAIEFTIPKDCIVKSAPKRGAKVVISKLW